MILTRRNLLIILGATAGAAALGTLPSCAAEVEGEKQTGGDIFTLPPLPYAYDALEPHIDKETMQFHHDRHHAGYVKNLNAAIDKHPDLKGKSAEDLLRELDSLPEDIQVAVRNNGGGHVNHSMFWEIMSPNGGGEPQGEIAEEIKENYCTQIPSKRFGQAEEIGVDLIVVGNRGLSGLKKMILGSVSSYVINHANCSVLVARSAD